jgi:hypothetical protein
VPGVHYVPRRLLDVSGGEHHGQQLNLWRGSSRPTGAATEDPWHSVSTVWSDPACDPENGALGSSSLTENQVQSKHSKQSQGKQSKGT